MLKDLETLIIAKDDLACSRLSDSGEDAGGYAISLQNNLLLALALPYLLIDFTMVCLWCGRSRNLGIYMLARDSYARGAPLMTS